MRWFNLCIIQYQSLNYNLILNSKRNQFYLFLKLFSFTKLWFRNGEKIVTDLSLKGRWLRCFQSELTTFWIYWLKQESMKIVTFYLLFTEILKYFLWKLMSKSKPFLFPQRDKLDWKDSAYCSDILYIKFK